MKVGDIYPTNKSGDIEIIEITDCYWVTVKFLDTGHLQQARPTNIRVKSVKDKELLRLKKESLEKKRQDKITKRNVMGVGFLGEGPYSYKNHPHHKILWDSMIRRCYKEGKGSPHYEDCSVCEDWHCFQTFCSDLEKLPGYDKWALHETGKGGRNLYQLDKDSINEGNKIYGPEHCQFLTSRENSSVALAKTFTVFDSGKVVVIYNLAKWCEDKGHSTVCMRQLMQGRLKKYKTFTKTP